MSISMVLCASIDLGGITAAPEWVHLLPAGDVRTNDGRGPFRVLDAAQIMATSIAQTGGRMVLCENHATDLAAPQGGEAPARGWIVELQQRQDGIWGRVEWTDKGRRLVEAREYRGISPVITHGKDGTVNGILRATLTNVPNLSDLRTLHAQEDNMSHLRTELTRTLGLPSASSDETIIAVVSSKMGERALHSDGRVTALGGQTLADRALMHQKKMADAGIIIGIAQAVRYVNDQADA